MHFPECDRDEVLDRLEELEDQIVERMVEYHELSVMRDMLYAADEGLIEIDQDGRCYPVST